MQVTKIGVDLAKNVFQVHDIAENDDVMFNKPPETGAVSAVLC